MRVGNITVPIFATAGLCGDRATLADAAALKGATPDSILLDAGDSLHGTESASLTGGMDMLSAFSAAGYDLHAMALTDFATARPAWSATPTWAAALCWRPTC